LFLNKAPKGNSIGLHLYHLSSDGKVKLSNDDKANAPFSNNFIELIGTKFLKKGKLSANLSYQRDALNYYGAPDVLLQSSAYLANRNGQEIQDQKFQKFALQSTFSTSTRRNLSYTLALNYHHFNTKTNQNEDLAALSGIFKKEFEQFQGKLESKLQYYTVNNIWKSSTLENGMQQNILLEATPATLFKGDKWELETGLTSNLLIDDDEDAKFYIYPEIYFEWETIDEILTAFAGIYGHLEENQYSKIAYENNYVNSSHNVKNTNHQITTNLGMQGKFNSKINFKIQGSYKIVKDMHFYYWKDLNPEDLPNDPNIINSPFNSENSHSVKYDDVRLINLKTEIQYISRKNFDLFFIGNWYNYNMDKLSEPWNKQNWDLTISSIGKPIERLTLKGDLYLIGKRKALIELFTGENIPILSSQYESKLNTIIDLNLGAEYELPNNLKAFAQINNFFGQNYEKWLGYNSYGFRFMGGFSWSF